MGSFDSFLFFESKSFESINRDYFKVVMKPTTSDEMHHFYFNKMQNITKALATLMTHSQESFEMIDNMLIA